MGVYLQEVAFHVDEDSWGSKTSCKLYGSIKAGVGVRVGKVLNESLHFYEEYTFITKDLPEETQAKLIDVYKDIQKFLDENLEFKLQD